MKYNEIKHKFINYEYNRSMMKLVYLHYSYKCHINDNNHTHNQ